MMTNGDRKGRIVLSNPHTNNGFFFSLTIKYLFLYWKKREKDFQKILNTLKCDMVTSRIDARPACGRRAAIRFYLSLGLVRVCEINRIHHWCSVGTEKSVPEGPVGSSGKRGLPSFPLNGGP